MTRCMPIFCRTAMSDPGVWGRSEATPPEPSPRGFTLLEVILALSLSAVVLGALAMAVDLTLRATNTGRADVAQAQLARVLLRRMSNDLRATVWYEPLDMSGFSVGSLGGIAGLGGGGDDGATDGGGGTGTDTGADTGTDSGGDDASTATSEEELVPPARPGLRGGEDWIEFDVSRIPRVDQYDQSLAESSGAMPIDLPSDIKTVAYFLNATGSVENMLPGDTELPQGTGLARRELDRAYTLWAAENGGLADLDAQSELIAPEVISMQFQYFDGLEWYTEWDSETTGALPLAVEILIAITPPGAPTVSGPIDLLSASPEVNYAEFRLLVHLASASQAGDETDTSTGEESL